MLSTRRIALGCALLAVLSGCATAPGAEEASLPRLAAQLLTSEDPAESIAEILASGASVEEIAAALRDPEMRFADARPGWRVLEPGDVPGALRPFHLYVPETYDRSAEHIVLFDLHGAVIGPGFSAAQLAERRDLWEATADAEGMLLVMPHGDREVHWWNEAGRANLRAQLRDLKCHYNVDEDRVFLSGFSDGGSGAYWMAFHDPTPWAGFLAFHGNPAIADLGAYPCYPRNLLQRPLRATNGARDAVYPAATIQSLIDQMLLLGVAIDWTVYDVGHDLSFFPTESGFSVAFMRATQRDTMRRHVVWETADPAVGRCDWVRIDEIGDVGRNVSFEEINFWRLAGSLELGIGAGTTTADGVTVAGVIPGTVAHFAGVRRGDVIARIGGRPIASSGDLGSALRGVEPGTTLTIEVVRDGERVELAGEVPGLDPVYRRSGTTATIDVTAAGNRIEVAARNVRRYTLLISSAMFDLSQPIVVVTNGAVSFEGEVPIDAQRMLEQAAEDVDRKAVYEGQIVVDLSVP